MGSRRGSMKIHGTGTSRGPGRSFELVNDVIKPYSHSVQQASPNKVSTRPVNAHRFLLWNLYGLDMTQNTDKYQLRCDVSRRWVWYASSNLCREYASLQ